MRFCSWGTRPGDPSLGLCSRGVSLLRLCGGSSWVYMEMEKAPTPWILITETWQSSTCWTEQSAPGISVLLKTIRRYSFALGCSWGFSTPPSFQLQSCDSSCSDFCTSCPFLCCFYGDHSKSLLWPFQLPFILSLLAILKNTYFKWLLLPWPFFILANTRLHKSTQKARKSVLLTFLIWCIKPSPKAMERMKDSFQLIV